VKTTKILGTITHCHNSNLDASPKEPRTYKQLMRVHAMAKYAVWKRADTLLYAMRTDS
jgi:hypothetical protein